MKHLRAILAVALLSLLALGHGMLVAACAGSPKAAEGGHRPDAPAIVDAASADLAHKVEGQKIEEAIQRRLGEIRAEQERVQRSIESWAYGAGMALAVGGALIFALGFLWSALRPLGGVLAVAGFLTLAFSRAVIAYGDSMAAVVAIGLCTLLAGGLVYAVLELRRYLRASKDMVVVGEKTKAVLPEESRKLVYGSGGIASHVYAPSTKRVVERIRTKLERNPA